MVQFSQLNNDVILEIFLQFVAIDWDGPFTLMLVCTKWSNLVVCQPRAWTWITVDDTQAEWRERMEVAAHLSKNLPLQIVLKVPFESQVSLSHITRHCTSLFLVSEYFRDLYRFDHSRAWAKTIVSYEQFTEHSTELKQSNDSVSKFLKGTPINDIQIRNEDHHYAPFAYSAWHVYERLNQRASIHEVIKPGEKSIITALVFKHSESAPIPRIQVLVTELWEALPLLSNLSYLELADNYIKVPKGTVLAHIQLRPLLTLKVESPMLGSLFFSLEDDVWLGLLSLLAAIEAPKLEDLSLHGTLHRIIAAMIKNHGRFHLSQINISISVLDETIDQEQLESKSVWHGLRRCTVHIPEQNKARRHTDFEIVGALRLLFNLIPAHCSFQLHGDAILEPILQSDLLMDADLHVITKTNDLEHIHTPLRWPRKIRSLSLNSHHSQGRKHVPWIHSVEELLTGWGLTLIYPDGPSLPLRVLRCGTSTLFDADIGFISAGIRRELFPDLTEIACDINLAVWMITNLEIPHLRSLTSWWNTTPPSSLDLFGVVEEASHRLLSLDTLGIFGVPHWGPLLHFVATFNRSRGRGISAVKLSRMPHPTILHHLGRAFRGEADQPSILGGPFVHQELLLRGRYPRGCEGCALFGWSCYGEEHCTRAWSNDMVEITADMPLTTYDGGWGPDGQGFGGPT